MNNQPLSEALYLVPPYRPEAADTHTAAFDAFRARPGQHRTTRRRGLVLGEIKDITPTRYGERLALRHLRGTLFASTELLGRAPAHTASPSPPRRRPRTPAASASSWSSAAPRATRSSRT